jgi:hypothetical protein
MRLPAGISRASSTLVVAIVALFFRWESLQRFPALLTLLMGLYTPDTVVNVQAFTQQPDGEEVIIGRAETGVFLAVPPEAVELLEHLAKGSSVGEVADFYQKKYGETPDLDDFLGLMESKGIIKSFSGSDSEAAQPARKVRYHFSNFSHTLAQRIFGFPALGACFALLALAIILSIRHPWLLTGPRDLFFPDHRTLCWTILTAATYASIYVHELAHLIAARAVGINSRMGISNRLWYIVAETDLTGLWSVPKRQRYLPLFAGTIFDALLGTLLVLLLYCHLQGWLVLSTLTLRLVRAMVFTTIMRMFWQCFLFIRTDFYYAISNFFNCRNLLKDTETFLRNQIARIIPKIPRIDQSGIPLSERRVIHGYAVVWMAGRAASFFLLFAVTIPIAIQYIRDLAGAFRVGYSANPSNFLDAVLLASYFLVPLLAGVIMWIGSFARRERI